jgi:hypothetical protein
MKKLILLLSIFVALSINTQAQRYLTPQFPTVSVTTNAVYGFNYTVLAIPVIGHTLKQPLAMDVYQPSTDTLTARPLIIYVPTGNFLRKEDRGSPTGDKSDSCATEICTRLAKLGYVVAAANYRIGWNPIGSLDVRNASLLQASYRGIQDIRSCVRFFKANAAKYQIDTNKIVVWGEGTGGYIALGIATLDNYNKILNTAQPAGKFLIKNPDTTSANKLVPVVAQGVHGDIEGKVFTTVTAPYAGYTLPVGDTTNLSNSPANSSKVSMVVNMGGALGDITWLDVNSTPIATIHCPNDPNAPFTDLTLQVPIGPGLSLPVIEVQGGYLVAARADSLGVNAPFSKLTAAYDPYKSLVVPRSALDVRVAAAATLGTPVKYSTGLLPLVGQSTADAGPWSWWSVTDTLNNHKGNSAANLAGNPNMGRAKSSLYIDSIMIFVLPRMCAVMNLPCKGVVTSTEDLLQASTTKLIVSPNPAISGMTFESEVFNPMHSIELFDMSGRQMFQVNNINSAVYNLQRNSLPNGIYLAKVKFEGGILTKKVVFQN